MKYIHIRNLERYQSGYKDRRSYWIKVYLDMIENNPDSEMLDEVSFARLVKMILLETCSKQMIPVSEIYMAKKGFDFGIKSLASTLDELSHFIEIVELTDQHASRTFSLRDSTVSLPREEKNREEKNISGFCKPTETELKSLFEERGLKAASALVEASKFLNYYETVGWVVGKARKPMKSWRGAVATWAANTVQNDPKVPAKRESKPRADHDACNGTGKLSEGQKCWCWT